MIQLNVDFPLLTKYFGISTATILQNPNKDIEEIMEIEAAKGNQKAKEYEKILADPDKLAEIFKLANVENRYIILQNMSEDDLDNLLPFLNQEQLAQGLHFFTDEKLMMLVNELPPEELIGMVFEEFSLEDVLVFMEEEAMNQFLKEPDVERKYAQKYFESLQYSELQKIMVEQFGVEYKEKSQDEYIDELKNLDDLRFSNFLLSLQREEKMGLIGGIVAQEEEFLLLFEAKDISRPMQSLMKDDKIKMMTKLDPEFLVPKIEELPVDLTQIVLTQIDPDVFAKALAKDFQNILSSVVLFSPQ